MTKLYIADVREIDTDRVLNEVSPFRREKAMLLKNDEEKRRSLAAALLMKKLLGTDEYKTSDKGKPYLDGLYFSLSHSGDYALLAVAESEVGADIERMRKCNMRLAEKYFSPEKCAEIVRANDPDKAFTQAWTELESRVKCSGDGIKALGAAEPGAYFTRSLCYEDYAISVSTTEDDPEVEICEVSLK